MEREFKFRYWNKNNSTMYQVDTLEFFVDSEILTNDGLVICEEQAVLMQYTGLKDKHGVEIFEGDIVECSYGIGVVIFSDGSFMVEWLDDKEAAMELLSCRKPPHSRKEHEQFEITGNIHEPK